jgi:hypothetical protein
MYKYLIFFLFIFSPLCAQEKWYVKGGLGINYVTIPKKGDIDVAMETGFYGSGVLGYQFNEHLRTEIEFSYRANEGYEAKAGSLHAHMDGSMYSFSGITNLLLDFPFEEIFIFSFGGGVGLHKTDGNLSATFDYKDWGRICEVMDVRKEGVVVQGLFGLLVRLSPQFGAGIEFKYWKVPDHVQSNTLAFNLKLGF